MRPRPLVLAVMAALVVSGLEGLPAPAEGGVALGERIAFASARGGPGTGLFEIFTVNPNGTGLVNVTGTPRAVDVDPAWSPDRSRIAFSRRGPAQRSFGITVADPEGGRAPVRLTNTASNDREPAWSPDGGRIAFARSPRPERSWQIMSIAYPDGNGLRRLTSTGGSVYNTSPAWSPDGSRIAFASNRGGPRKIWVMRADGSAPTRVTAGTCWDGNPSWSPLGDAIAFERLCPPGRSDVWKVAIPSGAATNLTGTTGVAEHEPSWSPDGSRILFTRFGSGGDKDLWRMNTDGAAQEALPINSAQADMTGDWGISASIVPQAGTSSDGEALEGLQLSSASSPAVAASSARRRRRTISRRVVRGVRYIRTRRARSDVYVLRINPRLRPRLDVAMANNRLPGHERTTSMVRRHRAVAGINGDFGLPSGRMAHTFAEDGDLKQFSFAVAPNFAISRDERRTFFDRPFERLTTVERASGELWPVDRWNTGAPAFNDVSVFTPAGGSLERPPRAACSARLVPASGRRWTPDLRGVEADYRVDRVVCRRERLAVMGGVVLSAVPGSAAAVLVSSLARGETVSLRWSLSWTRVADSVGGIPLLVRNGTVVAPRCSASLCRRHPRTAIGVTRTGRILMVVIDGRRRGSRGVTLRRLGWITRSFRAWQALNLDGGGSSTMVVKGRVMNVPSDGRERAVSSSILVLNRRDARERIGAATSTPTARQPAVSGDVSAADADAAAMDPGSTGGLLEAMSRGTFGPRVRLPAPLRRALEEFLESG